MFDLKAFRKVFKLTQDEVASILDVSRISVLKAEKGELPIPPRWIEVLKEKYGLELDPFLMPNEKGKHKITYSSIKYKDDKMDSIPLYSLAVEAGFENGLEHSPDYIEGYIQMPGIGKNNGSWVVSGHSMYPTISKGSRVVLRKIEDWNLIEWNNIYVVDMDEVGPKLKRVKKGSDKNSFTLVSDNSEFEPMIIKRKNIKSIHRVLIALEMF